MLETLGVPVVGYGTDEFPSFFSRSSGHRRADARRHPRGGRRADGGAQWDLGLGSGVSIANPVPAEDEMAHEDIDAVIEQALADCDAARHHRQGHHAVPARAGIVELSGGRSLETNLALVRNNAVVGTAIAVGLRRPRLTAPGGAGIPGGGSVGGMPCHGD